MATPTLVQSFGSASNENGETGNAFKINLPHDALAGNILILDLSWAFSAGRTISVTDDKSNTWNQAKQVDDTTNNNSSAVYYAMNVAAGTRLITITFDAAIFEVQFNVEEWYNVATSAALDGTVGLPTTGTGPVGPTVATGSFTPTTNNDANGGHLIHHYSIAAVGVLGNLGAAVTAITPGGSFVLASAQRPLACISQNFVQAANAAINPTVTVAQTVNDNFNTIAVAFKAAAAGTAPSGIRIVHVQQQRYGASGAHTENFPTSGNLIVIASSIATNQNSITLPSDSKGNTYAKLATAAGGPQHIHADNATPDTNMTVTFTLANATAGFITLYDIAGAATAPLDKFTEASGTQGAAAADVIDAPDITPATANGLVLASINFFTGPPTSMITAGTVADHVSYTGATDASLMTLGDGFAHDYNANTSAIAFGWHNASPSASSWTALAVAYKAPVAGTRPRRPVLVSQAVQAARA